MNIRKQARTLGLAVVLALTAAGASAGYVGAEPPKPPTPAAHDAHLCERRLADGTLDFSLPGEAYVDEFGQLNTCVSGGFWRVDAAPSTTKPPRLPLPDPRLPRPGSAPLPNGILGGR